MTDIVLAPRLEDPTSDVEPIVGAGWQYRVRVARTRTDPGQWVLAQWPLGGGWKPFTGAAVTLKLDPLEGIPYEVQVQGPIDPSTRVRPELHEFRFVRAETASGAGWQTLDQATDAGGQPVLPSGDQARLAALEARVDSVSGGASTLSEVSGISPDGRSLIETGSTFADMRADIGAAPATHTHSGSDIASGTVPAARLPSASDTAVGIVELATNAETTAGTDTARAVTPAGVAAAIAALGTIIAVPSVAGLSLRLTYQTSDLNAARPSVPATVSIDWEVPGSTPPTNIRRDLGDVWTSVY